MFFVLPLSISVFLVFGNGIDERKKKKKKEKKEKEEL